MWRLLKGGRRAVLNEIARGAKPARRQTGMSLEEAREMALVGKAAGEGGVRNGFAPRQQPARRPDATIGEVRVRRHPGLATEGAQQLELAAPICPMRTSQKLT